ncbi:MAG: penicillin-binding transpeptidase domain-containing protein [Acidimicrobiia bacterium]
MTSTVRTVVIGFVFVALLGVLVLRLWTMQVTDAAAYEVRAESNQVRVVRTPAPRGDIFDANGVKLAGTRSALAAVVDLALVDDDDLEMLARNLAAFLDGDASEILETLEDADGPQVTVAADLTDYQATFVVEHREVFPGVNIIPQPVRIYPRGEIGAHVIGYIGKPNAEDLERENVNGNTFVGKAGVEAYYDDELLGTEGLVEYQVDARRKVLSLVGEEAPTAGGSLVLTIDAEAQAQLQASLRDGLILARRDEMEQRAAELSKQSIADRLAEALADAQQAAREQEADRTEQDTTEPGTAEPGTDDDDVASPVADITIDPAEVLASLYPGLPIDDNGVCVPVQRVTVPLDGDAVLSGSEPRFIRLESIVDTDGVLEATLALGQDRFTVRDNQSFASTLQVVAVQEDRVILHHKDKWCPVRAIGTVIDPNDGSVVAMASYPAYDPAAFVDGLSDDQWAALTTESAFQNFAVQGLYAPASTFKTVPYVLAMEEGFYPVDRGAGDKELVDDTQPAPAEPLTTHTDLYNCSGEFRFELNDGTTQKKRDWLSRGHGPLDLHGALVESCDLYFWDVALRLWEERNDESGVDKENLLQVYARNFGFGTATGIDLPFERDGLVPDRAWFQAEQSANSPRVRPDGPWVGGDLMDIAVGQGAMLTTPLQMANGYAAMVNGGTLYSPRVVDRIVDGDGKTIRTIPSTVIRKVDMDPSTVRWLRTDLQRVVNDLGGPDNYGGTGKSAFYDRSGRNIFGDGVDTIGGKTGTGEVIKAPDSEAFREVDNAWFIGVAPISSPDFVVTIVVERGGSGGRVAAPIARQVLQYLLNGPEGVTDLAPGLDAD